MSSFPALLGTTEEETRPALHIHSPAEIVGPYQDLIVLGTLDLHSAGNVETASGGRRIAITGGSPETWAGSGVEHLYSGDSDEELEGILKAGAGSTDLYTMLSAPYRTQGADRVAQTTVSVHDHHSVDNPADHKVFLVEDAYWADFYLWLTANLQFGLTGFPYTFDSYLQWLGATGLPGVCTGWAFVQNGHEVLRLTSNGIRACIGGTLYSLAVSGVNVVVTGVYATPLTAALALTRPAPTIVADALRVGTAPAGTLTAPTPTVSVT